MWILEGSSEASKHVSVLLSPARRQFSVGRAATNDISIDFDKSVSRAHGTLQVLDKSSATQMQSQSQLQTQIQKPSPLLTFTDGGSRLGSFVNGIQVPPNSTIALTHGDELRLGAAHAVFRIVEKSIVIAFSGMKSNAKNALSATAQSLGIRVIGEFSPECTHLGMTTLKITMKTVLAVAHGTKIVTDAWIHGIQSQLNSNSFKLPNEVDYIPSVKEDNLTSKTFLPNDSRKSLFAGKQFLFFDAVELEMFTPIVNICGGSVVDCSSPNLREQQLEHQMRQAVSPIVISPEPLHPKFKKIPAQINSKDNIIYALLHINVPDHLTVTPQLHAATMLITQSQNPSPEPATQIDFTEPKIMRASKPKNETKATQPDLEIPPSSPPISSAAVKIAVPNTVPEMASNTIEDDDDDDLFQDLFKRKGKKPASSSSNTIRNTGHDLPLSSNIIPNTAMPAASSSSSSRRMESRLGHTNYSADSIPATANQFSQSQNGVSSTAPKKNLLADRLSILMNTPGPLKLAKPKVADATVGGAKPGIDGNGGLEQRRVTAFPSYSVDEEVSAPSGPARSSVRRAGEDVPLPEAKKARPAEEKVPESDGKPSPTSTAPVKQAAVPKKKASEPSTQNSSRQFTNAATVISNKPTTSKKLKEEDDEKELVPASDNDAMDEDATASKSKSDDAPPDASIIVEFAKGMVVKQGIRSKSVFGGKLLESPSNQRNFKRFRKNQVGFAVLRKPVALELA
ncbi:hypothetical protein BJ741DRAFT_634559 [Chytriomyces cf. hyalinus JEL632]|nr:hypothetical protein BJ741DRAFT_634559 [Chytriomyces cf. hyalinus JEL632]